MIYKEISYKEYWNLPDTTGAYLVLWPDGSKVWYNNELYHREDGPAFKGANGSKVWYLHGKPHREDGPAYKGADGTKEWYIHGKRHREDGPAVEWADGDKEWYLNGKEYETEEEWRVALAELRAKEIKDLIV